MLRFVSFGSYAPDLALYHDPMQGVAGSSQVANNVVPFAMRDFGAGIREVTYAQFPNLNAFRAPLDDRCQGAFPFFSRVDEPYIFAGDKDKLYLRTGARRDFRDVSGSSAPYDTYSEDYWYYTNFGDMVIATNYARPIQSYTIGMDSQFQDFPVRAPRAKYVATVKDFLVLGATIDGTSGTRPNRIWWRSIGDPTRFPTPGRDAAIQTLSDFQDLVGTFGQLRGIFPNVGQHDAILVFERAIWSMMFSGGNAIFEFKPIVGIKGSQAPKRIVQEGSRIYFYGEDGFKRFDGNQMTNIGLDRVDYKVKQELASPWMVNRIIGGSDPDTRCIIWAYPGRGSRMGVPNTLLMYHYAGLDEFSTAHVGEVETLFRAITFGINLEQLGALYPNLELVPFRLDSPVWTSNAIVMGGFTGAHRFGYFDGPALSPMIDTPQFQIGDGQNLPTDTRAQVLMARPVFGGLYAGRDTDAMVRIGHREILDDPMVYSTPVSPNEVGLCPVRVRGRYFVGRMSVTDQDWDNLLGIEIEMKPVGRR